MGGLKEMLAQMNANINICIHFSFLEQFHLHSFFCKGWGGGGVVEGHQIALKEKHASLYEISEEPMHNKKTATW